MLCHAEYGDFMRMLVVGGGGLEFNRGTMAFTRVCAKINIILQSDYLACMRKG